ncbi:MAG TPA: glycosyltransferase family 87 protein [Polyangia bacterium]|nr:glycosyltransferase family 87 protein [Polyangia bacterium]
MIAPKSRASGVAIVVHGALAAAFAIVVARTLADPQAIAQTDFTAFDGGWWLILHGRAAELYDVAAQRAAQHVLIGDHEFPSGLLAFLHPPHAALAGVPLGFISERFGEATAFRLWTALNVLLLAKLARGLMRIVAPTSNEGRAVVATALLGAFPVFLTLREGQIAIVLAVALLGLYEALRDDRPVAAAAWMLVLSFKPQYVPLPLALLVALRRWRALAFVAILGAAVAGVTAAALGPGIFARYLAGLPALQQHLGHGEPAVMLNLRGLLARLVGVLHVHGATVAAYVALVASTIALAICGRRARATPLPLAFAAVSAAAVFLGPHVFPADLTLWAVPLALVANADVEPSERFARFALAWPSFIAVTLAVGAWPRLFYDATTLLGLVAVLWIARLAKRTAPIT